MTVDRQRGSVDRFDQALEEVKTARGNLAGLELAGEPGETVKSADELLAGIGQDTDPEHATTVVGIARSHIDTAADHPHVVTQGTLGVLARADSALRRAETAFEEADDGD